MVGSGTATTAETLSQFSNVIARVLLGAQTVGKLFFNFSAAQYMDWTDFTDWSRAGDLAERAHPHCFCSRMPD